MPLPFPFGKHKWWRRRDREVVEPPPPAPEPPPPPTQGAYDASTFDDATYS